MLSWSRPGSGTPNSSNRGWLSGFWKILGLRKGSNETPDSGCEQANAPIMVVRGLWHESYCENVFVGLSRHKKSQDTCLSYGCRGRERSDMSQRIVMLPAREVVQA